MTDMSAIFKDANPQIVGMMQSMLSFGFLATGFVLEPETFPVFLKWLEIQDGGKPSDNWTIEKLQGLHLAYQSMILLCRDQ